MIKEFYFKHFSLVKALHLIQFEPYIGPIMCYNSGLECTRE